jgi:hypothetical protein
MGTGMIGGGHRSDRCAMMPSGCFEVEDMRRDRKAASRLRKYAIVGHPSNGAMMKIPKRPFGGVYLSLM